jgi:flagellar basal body rod protein FlgC
LESEAAQLDLSIAAQERELEMKTNNLAELETTRREMEGLELYVTSYASFLKSSAEALKSGRGFDASVLRSKIAQMEDDVRTLERMNGQYTRDIDALRSGGK